MSDPKEIFLMPECCADNEGRLWSEHDAPIDCEDGNPWTRYVRADEIERLTGLVSIYKQRDGQILDLQRELAAREIDLSHAALTSQTLERELAEALAVLEQAKKDALYINKQVSTFGLAHGMVARIDAFLAKPQEGER